MKPTRVRIGKGNTIVVIERGDEGAGTFVEGPDGAIGILK